jgi:hypothetical protein
MKKTILSALVLTTFIAASQAQTVKEDSFSRLSLSFSTPDVVFDEVSLVDSKYTTLNLDGYIYDGAIGSPALPVLSNFIVVPFCSDMKVTVSNAVYDTLQSNANYNWMPLQPSRSKSDRSPMVVQYDENVYNTDAFVSMPLAQIEEVGIARDRRLARIVFSPVSVNPVTGQYVVCRKADVTVTYVDADSAATVEYFQRYYTPAFSFGTTLNSLVNPKSVSTATPTRMVVVVPSNLSSTTVTSFIKWKRRQGFIVDKVTYGLGDFTSNTAIADYLKELYTNASNAEPAPTYLMIIGDHNQIPAFNGTVSADEAHVTDLYFVSWTASDNIPDCYQGRISATTKDAVATILNKILLYEQYGFADDSYLSKGILVSGVDENSHQTYTYCDPTMDYAARFYINANNGFNTVYYYKNNTDFNPAPEVVTITGSSQSSSATSELMALYNAGAGWVNYSAHGFWNSWYLPELTVQRANSLSNNNKPMFMIGNCCLSSKFDEHICLGEALIRRTNNAGAVAYIGATNTTYWTEDFYWSVGVRANISNTMNTNYMSDKLGMYDRLFHTHDEGFSDYAITAGAMVFYGNMAVQGATRLSSNNSKKYYWEIYELFGDPSMMPWLGQARDLTEFSVRSKVDGSGKCAVTINTVPYAYVALRDTVENKLLGADFANSMGVAKVTINDCETLSNTLISVTAQGYKPFFYADPTLDIDKASGASAISLYPNPATSQCTVAATGMQSARLLDSRGSLVGVYTAVDGNCTIDLKSLPRGIYFVQVQTPGNVTAKKLVVK